MEFPQPPQTASNQISSVFTQIQPRDVEFLAKKCTSAKHNFVDNCPLLLRDGQHYAYHLTDKGIRVALMFVLFHQRVCGPLANSLFQRTPNQLHPPITKFQAAYQKADASIQQVIDLLAA